MVPTNSEPIIETAVSAPVEPKERFQSATGRVCQAESPQLSGLSTAHAPDTTDRRTNRKICGSSQYLFRMQESQLCVGGVCNPDTGLGYGACVLWDQGKAKLIRVDHHETIAAICRVHGDLAESRNVHDRAELCGKALHSPRIPHRCRGRTRSVFRPSFWTAASFP